MRTPPARTRLGGERLDGAVQLPRAVKGTLMSAASTNLPTPDGSGSVSGAVMPTLSRDFRVVAVDQGGDGDRNRNRCRFAARARRLANLCDGLLVTRRWPHA